jgi:hypothetical protein
MGTSGGTGIQDTARETATPLVSDGEPSTLTRVPGRPSPTATLAGAGTPGTVVATTSSLTPESRPDESGTSPVPATTGTGTSESPSQPPVVTHGGAVETYVDVVDALRAQGATVEPADTIEQPFFSVLGQLIKVNGQDVQVFEFTTSEAAADAVASIGPDGNPATMMIRWIEPPHFYRTGRVIVLYVGGDAKVLETLTAALGPQFAGR